MSTNLKPHPGEVLAVNFLIPEHRPAGHFARDTALPSVIVEDFLRGEIDVTPDLAKKLAEGTGTTDQYWLDLQSEFDNQEPPS